MCWEINRYKFKVKNYFLFLWFDKVKLHNDLYLTGLEPAAPLFQGYSDEVQISKTDAKFVEIAHTETFPIVGPGELKARGNFFSTPQPMA